MTKTVEELTDELHVCQRRLADISGSTLEVDRVLQHAAKGAPAWLQDRLMQSRFLRHTSAGLFHCPSRRARHVAYLQSLKHDDRVVFADLGTEYVCLALLRNRTGPR